MQMLLPLLILVILGCIYAGSLKTSQSRLTVVVFILVIILILCYIQMSYKNKEMFIEFYNNNQDRFVQNKQKVIKIMDLLYDDYQYFTNLI